MRRETQKKNNFNWIDLKWKSENRLILIPAKYHKYIQPMIIESNIYKNFCFIPQC